MKDYTAEQIGKEKPAVTLSLSDVPALLTDLSEKGYTVLPGFCDVHVHFREPGFSYKETIKTGSLSAAAGGYTDVCAMPNLDPVPDCVSSIGRQIEIIKKDAVINVHPYAAITVGRAGTEVVDIESLSPYAVAFSDDGSGVQDPAVMERAMTLAKRFGKVIAAHCEDNSLLRGGFIHDGDYAKAHNHKGICSESEWRQIERDIELAAKTGCKYHVCHVSAKESVELIRQAKKSGVDITCETAPHYLVLDDGDLIEDGRYKMNPPLRGVKDKEALIEGAADGTIDMIATDHAPHSAEEKSKGLEKSAFGIVGLETAFPVLYTELVRKNVITLERLVYMLDAAPRNRFGIKQSGLSVWSLDEKYKIDPQGFYSKGRSTPFDGKEVYGRHVTTILYKK
ncbi:MAG: dihydroorotase [Clostridia bacterium]|nr:dihydroorotase [Clostridia bacterium]